MSTIEDIFDDEFPEKSNQLTERITDFSYLWRQNTMGAPVTYAQGDSQKLRSDCVAYFVWCQEHPLYSAEVVRSRTGASVVSVPKLRAYSIGGLCQWLGITHQTWLNWREERDDLFETIAYAEQVISTQKFEAAAAELLNPGFIARDLGMVDRRDVTSKDKSIKDETDFSQLTDEELDQIASLSRKMKKGS